MKMLQHLQEASRSAVPVDLLLTNGHRVTGIPYITEEEESETVTVSTSYEFTGYEQNKPKHGANESGYWIDPDKAPTHVRLDHISTFAYKED